MVKFFRSVALGSCLVALATPAAMAAFTEFTSQAPFEAALDGSFTLLNLDASPFDSIAGNFNVASGAGGTAFGSLGVTFSGFDADVIGGQAFQIETAGRDRLIANGNGFGGEIVLNFGSVIDGIAGLSNNIDGGTITAFSEINATGMELGSVEFGRQATSAGFGGLVSDISIRSVRFSCEVNSDLRCGVYDIQFGTVASGTGNPGGPTTPVSEPASLAILGLGALVGGLSLRRRGR